MNVVAVDRVRLPTEAVGRVRALRAKIDTEDKRYVSEALRLLAPVRARLRRHPERHLRPQMLADIERAWHHDLASPYRLWCRAELRRDRLHIRECAISAAKLEASDWAQKEMSLVLSHGELIARRGAISFECTATAIVSLHALCRRLQRGLSTTDEELLNDVALLAGHDVSEVPEGEGFKVHTPAGKWLGRSVRIEDGSRLLSVRTWLNERGDGNADSRCPADH